MKQGSVTIYLSLILAVILSLFLTVIEGAKSRAVSLRADCALDLSVYSLFAEYNRQLYKEYGLLFIDTSYGEMSASTERVNRHFRYYMEENLDRETSGFGVFDFTKCRVDQTQITGCSYATDQEGAVFERQAVEYMKHRYGIAYVEKLQRELMVAQEKGLFTRDFSAQREENHGKIETAEREGIETGELDENGTPIRKMIDIDNPADAVNVTRSKGILWLVTGAEDVLSGQCVNQSETVSRQRPKTKGFGDVKRDTVSVAERLLFDAYVLEKCGTYLEPKKTGQLQYQAEYVLAGKESDIENLKEVAERLLLLREVSNCIYILSDGAKVAEASALSATICGAVGAITLVEAVKYTLLFAWAYAESVYDVRQLLAGKRIPLVKDATTWHSSLSGMLTVSAEQISSQEVSGPAKGLSYEEYLRLFLAVEGREKKVYRMMDIVQMDVRKNSGFDGFYLSNCVDLLIMEATVTSKYGYFKEVKRKYCYI